MLNHTNLYPTKKLEPPNVQKIQNIVTPIPAIIDEDEFNIFLNIQNEAYIVKAIKNSHIIVVIIFILYNKLWY